MRPAGRSIVRAQALSALKKSIPASSATRGSTLFMAAKSHVMTIARPGRSSGMSSDEFCAIHKTMAPLSNICTLPSL